MIWDNMGLPVISGASDKQDSAMFAGMLTTFGWPQKIYLCHYITPEGNYVRHPSEHRYSFSRDQTIPLFAGLKTQGLQLLVDPDYKTEGDFVDPGVRGHIRRCAGLKATWFQDAFLWTSILWHIHLNADHESNPLLCMLFIHPDVKYLKYFCSHYDYKKSIREYWCEGPGEWRKETEFSECMIKAIEEKLMNNLLDTNQIS